MGGGNCLFLGNDSNFLMSRGLTNVSVVKEVCLISISAISSLLAQRNELMAQQGLTSSLRLPGNCGVLPGGMEQLVTVTETKCNELDSLTICI